MWVWTILDGVIRSMDYIFGKNATGYSFLTGFGSKQVMFPHHRPSGADGVVDPVPGFIIGGPNKDMQDRRSGNRKKFLRKLIAGSSMIGIAD